MKPLFSEEEKKQAVRTFLIALRHRRAKITSYIDIKDRLNSGRMNILCKLDKSGQDKLIDKYSLQSVKVGDPYYAPNDAKVYFEWLDSAVSGTLSDSIGDDLIKAANDQLFNFIQVMQQSGNVEIDSKIQMIEPYDWQKIFTSFDERLTDIQKIIDKGNKDITEVLKDLKLYLRENKTLLKQIKAESETFYKKVK